MSPIRPDIGAPVTPEPPRWKRWMHVVLPSLLSCGVLSIAFGLAFGAWWEVLFGAFCLGGFARGIFDRQIRQGGYRWRP